MSIHRYMRRITSVLNEYDGNKRVKRCFLTCLVGRFENDQQWFDIEPFPTGLESLTYL